MNIPCKDCTRRKQNCHSTCQDYIDFKKEREEQLKKQQIQNSLKEYAFDRQLRLSKHFRARRY